MTTLFQTYIEGRKYTNREDIELLSHLQQIDGPVAEPVHKYVFSDDISTVKGDLVHEKRIDVNMITEYAVVPHTKTWVEWGYGYGDGRKGKYGGLFIKLSDGQIRIFVSGTMGTAASTGLLFTGHIAQLPVPRDEGRSTDKKWMDLIMAPQLARDFPFEDIKAFAHTILSDMIFCLFLMSHPKTYDTEEIVFAEKLQKARAKSKKPKLLPYTRMTITLNHRPKDTRSSSEIGHGTGRKMPYHYVPPYFKRVHFKDHEEVKLIAGHWKGNPEVGFSKTEHRVKVKT